MTDHHPANDQNDNDNGRAPTLQGEPVRELEHELKKNPQDPDLKTDVGSDESMDASDPISSTQPGTDKPAPSSGFPE